MCGGKGGACIGCRFVAPLILAVTMLLLLLVMVGVGMGTFGELVMKYWPGGVLLYALAGLCPCKGGECCGSCKTDKM